MSDIERIQRYIEKTGVSPEAVNRYCMTWNDVDALYSVAIQNTNKAISALILAFNYGQAKGYRAAKAKAKHG